jgi:hypothetical protein
LTRPLPDVEQCMWSGKVGELGLAERWAP